MVLITGANGFLGQHLVDQLCKKGISVAATGRGPNRLGHERVKYYDLDLTDGVEVKAMIADCNPDVIVHSAALSLPDVCEQHKDDCYAINVKATETLVNACHLHGIKLVFVSTDFVFNGEVGLYEEEDKPDPVNYYGQTKWEAEQLIYPAINKWAIARTVLVYGNAVHGTRSNIVTWVKQSLEKGEPIKVVSDQVRTPTYVVDLADGIVKMIVQNAIGIYHISGEEILTPYDMALKVADYFKLDASLITKTDSTAFVQPAKRPLKTGFKINKAVNDLGYQPRSFVEGLKDMY